LIQQELEILAGGFAGFITKRKRSFENMKMQLFMVLI
jgi:hypothetical protein